MAAAILAAATGTFAADYPLAVDIGCYHHSPATGTEKPAVARYQGFFRCTLFSARYQDCFRCAVFNARSSG